MHVHAAVDGVHGWCKPEHMKDPLQDCRQFLKP